MRLAMPDLARVAARAARALVIAALALAGACLLIFGPRDIEEIPEGRVVINYWEKWSGVEADTMRAIVDDFNATIGAQKNIHVRFLSMAGVDQKTRVATAAGVPPEVSGIWSDRLAQLTSMDALEPLTERAEAAGLTSDYYKPVFYNDCLEKGQLMALPTTPATVALLWNRLIFQERANALRAAGCDPTRAPQSIEELDRYAKALEIWSEPRSGGGRDLLNAGYLPVEPNWFVAHMWLWFGGEIWHPDAPPDKQITLLDENVLAAYEWMASYTQRLGTRNLSAFGEGDRTLSPQNPFITGQVAMIQQGPWMAAYIDTFGPHVNRVLWQDKEYEMTLPIEERRKNYAWAAAPFPAAAGADAGGPITITNLDVVVIPRGAKHQAEAFEFIAYLQRQDVMERLCLAQCKNSPLAVMSEQFRTRHTNPYLDVFDGMADSPNARHPPHCPVWAELGRELEIVAESVSLGTSTARAALEAAQHRMDGVWARYLEQQSKRAGN